MNILITGATGNIGTETIRALSETHSNCKIICGVHNLARAKETLSEFKKLEFRTLDFTHARTFNAALKNIDIVFLLRPPQLADVPKYFAPFTRSMKEKGISKIIFLSVQGVETQKFIPHHKIEKRIKEEGFDYTFLRPSYFMQNLETTLVREIREENRIYIPAGDLKFNWVDTRDIGQVAAEVLCNFERHKNEAYEITGSEFMDFREVAQRLSEIVERKIAYKSPNLCQFYLYKRKQGMSVPMIFVMIMLHYLPRFGKNEARLTTVVKDITGENPGLLSEYLQRNKNKFST